MFVTSSNWSPPSYSNPRLLTGQRFTGLFVRKHHHSKVADNWLLRLALRNQKKKPQIAGYTV